MQTLAANVDQVAVVASTAEPDFRPGFVDRVLVCASACNLPAAIILNKIDLGVNEKDAELLSVYRGFGLPIFLTSTRDVPAGAAGLSELKTWMAGKRTVLTGHSGVGKSSLMLALDPALSADDVRTAEVSTQTRKGVHTTTHARLFEVDFHDGTSAEIVDTPGVREFTPADTDRRNLWGWFPEIARLQGQCAFANCTHIEEKGCAILAALERGEIHPRRHRSYVRIYQTLPQ
jgi:ribosome biogenesis GTPase